MSAYNSLLKGAVMSKNAIRVCGWLELSENVKFHFDGVIKPATPEEESSVRGTADEAVDSSYVELGSGFGKMKMPSKWEETGLELSCTYSFAPKQPPKDGGPAAA